MNLTEYISFTKNAPIHEIVTRAFKLFPLHVSNYDDPGLAFLLSMWRNNQRAAYPSQFKATKESTLSWLSSVYNNPNRIFWYVIDKSLDDEVVGTVGLQVTNGQPYIDFIQRGAKGVGAPKIIRNACHTLLSLLPHIHHGNSVYLKVLGDNTNAIKVYKEMGFEFYVAEPCEILRDTIDTGSVLYKPTGEILTHKPLTDIPYIATMVKEL